MVAAEFTDCLPAEQVVPCDGAEAHEFEDERPAFDHDYGSGRHYEAGAWTVTPGDCAHDEAAAEKALQIFTLSGHCRREADYLRERVLSTKRAAEKQTGHGSLFLDGIVMGLEDGVRTLDRLGGRESW